MVHKELEAPKAISDSISGFWYRDMDFGPTPSSFEVLPDGHAEIIFHFGSGCSLLADGQAISLPSPYIVGLLGKPVYFQAQHRLQIIGVKCLPWAIYDLLQLPTLGGGVQNFTHPIASLQIALGQLLQTQKIDEALALLSDWFVTAKLTVPPVLFKAGQAMLNAGGSLPVNQIAAAAHATVRTLERKFKASSGHTLKDVSGLIRFEQARDRLWHQPDNSLSALAHELGYADQSHLNRDFKRYSGLTAGAFARQTKKRKAAFGHDFVAIVLSA